MSGTKIQCIFVAIGLSTTTRAATTNTFLYFFTGNYTNSKSDTLNEILKTILIGSKIQNVFFISISTDSLGSPVTRLFTDSAVDLTNTNSSDVGIITPTTNTPTTTVSTTTTTTTTSKPATTAGSNALHHAASQGKNSIQPHQANVF